MALHSAGSSSLSSSCRYFISGKFARLIRWPISVSGTPPASSPLCCTCPISIWSSWTWSAICKILSRTHSVKNIPACRSFPTPPGRNSSNSAAPSVMAGPSVTNPAYKRAVNSGFQFCRPSWENAYFHHSDQTLASSTIVCAETESPGKEVNNSSAMRIGCFILLVKVFKDTVLSADSLKRELVGDKAEESIFPWSIITSPGLPEPGA